MNHRIAVLTALIVIVFAAAAYADGGANFVSGNKNNDGQYTPRKVRTFEKDPDKAPGFWDKEWERSGLNKTVGGAWWSPLSKTGSFFKDREAEYREKHPAGADR